VKHIKRTTNYL